MLKGNTIEHIFIGLIIFSKKAVLKLITGPIIYLLYFLKVNKFILGNYIFVCYKSYICFISLALIVCY